MGMGRRRFPTSSSNYNNKGSELLFNRLSKVSFCDKSTISECELPNHAFLIPPPSLLDMANDRENVFEGSSHQIRAFYWTGLFSSRSFISSTVKIEFWHFEYNSWLNTIRFDVRIWFVARLKTFSQSLLYTNFITFESTSTDDDDDEILSPCHFFFRSHPWFHFKLIEFILIHQNLTNLI